MYAVRTPIPVRASRPSTEQIFRRPMMITTKQKFLKIFGSRFNIQEKVVRWCGEGKKIYHRKMLVERFLESTSCAPRNVRNQRVRNWKVHGKKSGSFPRMRWAAAAALARLTQKFDSSCIQDPAKTQSRLRASRLAGGSA